MKKLMISALLALFTAATAAAQTSESAPLTQDEAIDEAFSYGSSTFFSHNVDSYGIATNSISLQVSDALLEVFAGAIAAGFVGIFDADLTGMSLMYSIAYDHHFPDTRWAVGADTGLFSMKITTKGGVTNTFRMVPLAATGKFYYLPKGVCKLYGSLALGACLSVPTCQNDETGVMETSVDGISPYIQVNPIGMRLGSERLAFVAELGFGHKGILQLGVNVGL